MIFQEEQNFQGGVLKNRAMLRGGGMYTLFKGVKGI